MPRKITENLYISDAIDARIHGDDFDEVVSMSSPPDSSTQEFIIKDGDHKYDKFADAVDYVIQCLNDDLKTLVHCNAGISRSVSVSIAAYVCYYDNVDYESAFEKCQTGFMYPNEKLIESTKKYINNY